MSTSAILRAWKVVDRVSPWTMHAEAAALLFRADSLPQRLLSSIARIDYSGKLALQFATRRHVARWPIITSKFVLATLARFGAPILTSHLSDSDDQVAAWDLGGHLVVQIRMRDCYDHRATAPNDELIRVAVALTTAELGTSRLYIDRDGLVADSSDYGRHIAEQTRDLIEDLRAEFDAGEACRTVLLYGPPGSGKSTMARQLAAAFAETVVAVDGVSLLSDDVSHRTRDDEPDHVVSVIRHCGAQAVVLDDYDRRRDEGHSLALIRDLRGACRLVVITANDIRSFSPAELRAGRVDKVVRVDGLDMETARRIAPDLPESIRDRAYATLLAAYLHELAVLCRAGRIDHGRALSDLQERQAAGERP